MERTYRVGQVAALTRVSIRALHHYDRVGVLRPSGHSEGGHRLYSEADLLRLQQVLTLRYLGFPLERIGSLLDRPDFSLVAALQIQRRVLRERVAELEAIEAALGALIEGRMATGHWDWQRVAEASAAVQTGLTGKGAEMEQRFTPEQMRQFEALAREVPPEEIRAIEDGWAALLAEVRANRDLDPASERAHELADRWQALTDRTMRHYKQYPELKAAIAENYRQQRYADTPQAPQPEDFAFIARVNEVRGKSSDS